MKSHEKSQSKIVQEHCDETWHRTHNIDSQSEISRPQSCILPRDASEPDSPKNLEQMLLILKCQGSLNAIRLNVPMLSMS